MEMIGFLILFPLVVAALLLIFRQNKVRNAIVWVASIVIMGASIAFVAMNIGTPGQYFLFESVVVDWASIAISVIVGAIVIFYSVKYRRFWVLGLAAIQLIGTLIFEFGCAHDIVCTRGLYVDSLSLIMTLIIGLVGAGICIYSIGYMEDRASSRSCSSSLQRCMRSSSATISSGSMLVGRSPRFVPSSLLAIPALRKRSRTHSARSS